MESSIADFNEDFIFALEMVILKRNKNGATLSEIRDDFENYFGINSEELWGYRCWEQQIRPILTNIMCNISSQTLEEGCVLYYMDVGAAIQKLSGHLTDGMKLIKEELNVNLAELKKMRQSGSQSRSTNSSANTSSTSSGFSSGSDSSDFLGHLLIGDNFFLDMVHLDLGRPIEKVARIKKVGHCVSGQNIKRATYNISRVINEIYQEAAIINLGSIDLLQGRELVDMMQDMRELAEMLVRRNIFPIVTTLAPLANQMHTPELEKKRKRFNTILRANYDCIDIEKCFLDVFSHISFDSYQSDARTVTGTRRPLVLWNDSGRRHVLKMLKRKLPEIHRNEGYQSSA